MEHAGALPRPDADSRPYWEAAGQGRLVIQVCQACDTPRFYPRLLCPECHSDQARWQQSSGRGSVYSFSVVHRAPTPAFRGRVPYVVALIDLDDGVRMFANIDADPAEVTIGSRVAVTFHPEAAGTAVPDFVLDVQGSHR